MDVKAENAGDENWKNNIQETHVDYSLMQNMIFDYLITEGYHEVAESFKNDIKNSGFKTELPVINLNEPAKIRKQIRDAILKGDIKLAESIINRNYSELLDDNHLLHFYLQIQHLIELIRSSKIEEAVSFAQEDIVEKGDYPECLPDLERAMGLLAFENPEKSPFSDLLQPGFRLKVWSRVNEAILNCEQQKTQTKLSASLKYVMWSEKQLQERKIQFTPFNQMSSTVYNDVKTEI